MLSEGGTHESSQCYYHAATCGLHACTRSTSHVRPIHALSTTCASHEFLHIESSNRRGAWTCTELTICLTIPSRPVDESSKWFGIISTGMAINRVSPYNDGLSLDASYNNSSRRQLACSQLPDWFRLINANGWALTFESTRSGRISASSHIVRSRPFHCDNCC